MRQYRGVAIDQNTGRTKYTKWYNSWREAWIHAIKLARSNFNRFEVGVM